MLTVFDSVSYAWGGDKKGGTVTEGATEGSLAMETARGNTATKETEPNHPAVRLERAGHDVVKNASEVQKEEAGETHNEGGVQKTVTEEKTGEKRAAEPKENGEEPKKKKGRPAKNGTAGPKKDTKKRPPKKAATETGEPRRSGRNVAKSS